MANTSPQTDIGRGDIPFVLDQLAPDVEWIETESPNVPTHGTSRTPQDVLENVFMKLPESFGSFEVHPDSWIESTDNRDLDAPFAHVFTVRDGKVTRNDLFNDSALWVSALA